MSPCCGLRSSCCCEALIPPFPPPPDSRPTLTQASAQDHAASCAISFTVAPDPTFVTQPLVRHSHISYVMTDESCYSETVVRDEKVAASSGDQAVAKAPSAASRKATFILLAIFTTSLTMLFIVYLNFPHLEEREKVDFKIPRNKEDARRLGQLLSRYSDKHFFTVLFGIVVFYIFLQSFAIPGSSWLTVLSGYIFPWPIALLVVCFCSAVGASLCYLIFSYWGRPLVLKQFPGRVAQFSDLVEAHRSYILLYIIVLRVTPILPNWFINVSSPVIDVPFWPFCIGTFIGVAPLSMMAIGAVKALGTESMLSSFSMFAVAAIAGFAVIHVVRKRFSVDHVIPVIQ